MAERGSAARRHGSFVAGPDRRGPARRPRRRRGSPRRQAGQPARARRRNDQGHRLRHRPRRRLGGAHRGRPGDRDRRYISPEQAIGERGDAGERHLFARCDRLRDARRASPVHGRQRRGAGDGSRASGSAAAAVDGARPGSRMRSTRPLPRIPRNDLREPTPSQRNFAACSCRRCRHRERPRVLRMPPARRPSSQASTTTRSQPRE